MCGLAGIVDLKRGIDPLSLKRAVDNLRHRGPDDEGYMLLDYTGMPQGFAGRDTVPPHNQAPRIASASMEHGWTCGMAFRRLSILDLSPAGHQPMVDPGGNVALAMNGEVYNYRELRNELLRAGHTFRSESDAEVALHAYMEWGPDAVTRFIGMWALAILDIQKRRVFLSRDRFGIKPLYLVLRNGFLAFASEIKAILAAGWTQPLLEVESALQFLVTGRRVHPESTLFKGIRELPAGTNAVLDLESWNYQEEIYYDMEQAVLAHDPVPDEIGDAMAGYADRFREAIALHLRADVVVGTCLSGGLDSSAITVIAAEMMNGNPFNSFTAVFDDFPSVNERNFAESVVHSRENIHPHWVTPYGDEFRQELERMTYAQDQPFGSTSIYAQWAVMRSASQEGMKVLLDGQGADESLGGYSLFGGEYLLELLKSFRLYRFVREFMGLRSHREISPLKQIHRVFFQRLPASKRSRLRRSMGLYARILKPGEMDAFTSVYPEENGIEDFRSACISNLKHGLHELLRYEDRNSMAFSIESRVPFLDHRLVEYSLKLPTGWKIRSGWTKYPIRFMLSGMVDDRVAWRKDKKGFVAPQSHWSGYINQKLLDLLDVVNLPPFLKKQEIHEFLVQKGTESIEGNDVWRLLSFLEWMKVFQVQVS